MFDRARLFQKKLVIGNNFSISLKNGREYSGKLLEIAVDHLSLEKNDGSDIILFMDDISACEAIKGEAPEQKGENGTAQREALRPVKNEEPLSLPVERTIKLVQREAPQDMFNSQVSWATSTQSSPMDFSTPPSNPQDSREDGLKLEVFKRLLEIEVEYKGNFQAAKLVLVPPNFSISVEDVTSKDSDWGRIKNKFEYAEKVNELGSQFGRMQPLIADTTLLIEKYPTSSGLRRHLAYFHFLAGNNRDALKYYKEASIQSNYAQDWYNLAVLARQTQEEALTCYSLLRFFSRTPMSANQDAWYIFVGLISNAKRPALLNKVYSGSRSLLTVQDQNIWLEASIYVIKNVLNEALASKILRYLLNKQGLEGLIQETQRQLNRPLDAAYEKIASEFTLSSTATPVPAKKNVKPPVTPLPQIVGDDFSQPQGYIIDYRANLGYGTIQNTASQSLRFHLNAIIDEELRYRINNYTPSQPIPVTFTTVQEQKGLNATKVSLYRTINQMFEFALSCAKKGEYNKAISQIRKVIELNSEFPEAQKLLEEWRAMARISGVPRGSNSYALAKRMMLNPDGLENAVKLLHTAIEQGDNLESAVKDLAALLVRMERGDEAIDVLQRNRHRMSDQQSTENLLINIYMKVGDYHKAIDLLKKKVDTANTDKKRFESLGQIAKCYMRLENYPEAEKYFRSAIASQSDNRAIQRSLALCLIKMERYEEADQILKMILEKTPEDAQTAELLDASQKAQQTGQSNQIDEMIQETTHADFSDFGSEISGFTRFFLERCKYEGVPPIRVQENKIDRTDVRKLEELAKDLGTRNPGDRSKYYLSAAKIISNSEDTEDPNQLYKYLGRSFTSRGDASIFDNKPLDAARSWYNEALSVYDGDRSQRQGDRSQNSDERDAANALVRFLYATIDPNMIPLTQNVPTLDETLDEIMNSHNNKVFDAIAYLSQRSRYARTRLYNQLRRTPFKILALNYLRSKNLELPVADMHSIGEKDFKRLWHELLNKNLGDERTISTALRMIAKFELKIALIEQSIRQIREIKPLLFLDLDNQRLTRLNSMLDQALDLCKQVSFEERERLCTQIEFHCQDLKKEIVESPTKLSIEQLYAVIEAIQKKTKEYQEYIYENSLPQIALKLSTDTYFPDGNLKIEVQVRVENGMGLSPAESLQLIVKSDQELFTIDIPEIKIDSSLRGGEHKTLIIPIQVTNQALNSQAFSLPVQATYGTRLGEKKKTPIENFSISLYPKEQFERINNPYAEYAEGGPVSDFEMFYGRKELITNIAKSIGEAKTPGKTIVIYGQKRAGKSSILHHLNKKLKQNPQLIIADIENIGRFLDVESRVPLLYQILWKIISQIAESIDDEINEHDRPMIDFPQISFTDFANHESPLMFFNESLRSFKKQANQTSGWENTHIVVLIDEFSYIYSQIVAGKLSGDFMKNWKALIEQKLFSAVIVGQDVMPKFKQQFANEFGTIQDERVSYLKREEAVLLIDEPMRIGGKDGQTRYLENAIQHIIDLTASSPFYIQLLCNRLVDFMNYKLAKFVTEATVEQLKTDLINGTNSLGQDKFDNLISAGDTSKDAISEDVIKDVLKSIAINSQTGPCDRNSIQWSDESEMLNKILDDLVKREIVEHVPGGQGYRIRVGLFKEWLIANQ